MFRNRVLDRRVQFDKRSLAFRAVEGIESKPLRSYTWACDIYNDQGVEGACVGFAWSHELSARPAVYRVGEDVARALFYRARQIDEWPGEDYQGTSVLAGVKATMEVLGSNNKPLYGAYHWAFGTKDVALTVGYKGPVVLGINWYEDMYYPNETGFITPTGELVGGHAILCNGIKVVKKDSTLDATWSNVDLDKSYVRLHNSWGPRYGIVGDAFLTLSNLQILLKQDGEACIPTARTV